MVLWILFEEGDQCADDKRYHLENENEKLVHVFFSFSVMRFAALGRRIHVKVLGTPICCYVCWFYLLHSFATCFASVWIAAW